MEQLSDLYSQENGVLKGDCCRQIRTECLILYDSSEGREQSFDSLEKVQSPLVPHPAHPIVSKVRLYSTIEALLSCVLLRKMNRSVLLLRSGSQSLFIGESFKLH